MDIVALLKQLADTITALQAQLVDAQAAADALAKLNYDKGFADGVASVVVDPSKQFSQADLDKAVADAVSPLNDKIVALQAQVDGVPALIAQAKADLKAAFLVILQADEVDAEAKLAAL